MVYIVRYENHEVTDYYLNIVEDAFFELGCNVKNIKKIEDDISKTSIIVVSTITDVIKCYSKGFRNIFLWMQGIDAEESYVKHHNALRKFILEIITYFAVRMIKGIYYVSNEMKNYIEKKYKKKNKFFIMPCFNTDIDVNSFEYANKYKKNIFTYVGSLSKWQCFNETVDFYKEIEKKVENTQLKVYTFSEEEAKKILREKRVKNYYIGKVSPEKIQDVLKEAKFGFTLREDIFVNNVATPTKFSSYLSAGVIPIFSLCIKDFYEKTLNKKYIIPIKNFKDVSPKIIQLCKKDIDTEEILKEYKDIFSNYYNRDKYKENMKKWLRRRISEIKNI